MTTFSYVLRDAFRLVTRNITLSFLTLVTTVAVFLDELQHFTCNEYKAYCCRNRK